MWTKPEGKSSFYRVQWNNGTTVSVNDTKINVNNLTAGVQYEITVTAVADDGSTEGRSEAVSQYTKPEVVRNLNVSEITTSSISLMWTKPEGKSSFYRVQWTDGNVTDSDNVTEAHINITNLTAGVQYEITVTAVAGDGSTEGRSEAVSQYTKPEVVRNLNVSEITTSSVSLSWTEPEGKSSFYRVQWIDGNLNQTHILNETHINITELTAGEQYNFTVVSVAGDQKTLGEAKTISLYTKPEVVRNLNVSEITTSSISLTWTKPEGKSSFYRVQWTDGNVTDSGNVTEAHINITNLTAGVQYEITVTAVAGDGSTEGRSEAVSQYTKPEVVRNLNVSEITTSSVSLSWTKPEGKSSFYRVQWIDGNLNLTRILNETHINITELTAGEQYNFTVVSVAGDQKTLGEAKTISLYTKPEVVRNLNVSEITTSSISLMWTKPEGKSSFYRVQWTDGNVTDSGNVTEAHINITNLTAGVQYEITVTAVAGDGSTEGRSEAVSQYTKPEVVRNLNVSEITTSSVSLSWTEPEGKSSFYRVQWIDGNLNQTHILNETHINNITELTAGEQYNFTVVSVAGDQKTLGEAKTISLYTKPEVVRNLNVSEITTSSVSLTWTKPEGKSSFYRVQWTDGNVTDSGNVTETHINITNLTAGVQYEITVTAVAGDSSTEGRSEAVSQYTKPEVVRNLNVSEITTSSVSLTWTEPEGKSSFYRVQWIDGNLNQTHILNETHINITELTAGEQYNFTVVSVAGDQKTLGEAKTISLYTKPEVVRNLNVSEITTSSVSLTWTKPEGKSSFYRVQWTDGNVTDSGNVTETHINITNLTAGVQYEITVTAVAGDSSTEGRSEAVSQYTKPEVVRNLNVSEITTSSVSLSWTEPEGKSSFYRVQWIDGNLNQTHILNETHINITELTAGEQYNFTVVSVAGDQKTLGEAKTISLYTKPEVVRNLNVSEITTSSVSLTWTKPEGKSSFYRVQWTDGNVTDSGNVTEAHINITNLTAGVQYEITVTAVAGDSSTEGRSEAVSQYTKPEVVRNLNVSEITTSSVSLSWTEPEGKSSFYRVQWIDGNLNQTHILNETHINITELTAGEQYNFTVVSVAGDQKTLGEAKTIFTVYK
ncbi:receptor-type tyrosine-protein phosphatase eta [Plectropomus leopardus]|uniref:receptor-type tyrosine-protein phosphatase eta n=1 Tax=Plectropomus leopardus TaxID=160734 RepID=UPI001C4AC9D5|nr:receptor-type tyrosine-protein phosphatase eta [Plectropomus leopardus]